MAKLYYGDENNTAVEINVKGDPGPGVADGGTAGQVLAKKSTTDYDTKWIDPPSGSDPDAIKKDGTTTTTARIPFAEGIDTPNINFAGETLAIQSSSGEPPLISFDHAGGNLRVTAPNLYLNGTSGVRINSKNEGFGTSGQVLTAKGDGTCGWADAAGGGGTGSYEERIVEDVKFVKQGRRVDVVWNTNDRQVTFNSFSESGSVYKAYNSSFYGLPPIPEGFRPASIVTSAIPLHDTSSNGDIWGYVYIEVEPDGTSTTNAKAFRGDSITSRVSAFTRGQIMIGWYTE